MNNVYHRTTSPIGRQAAPFGVLCSIVVALVSPAGAREAIKSYPTLTLKDGRQFSDVEIVQCTNSRAFLRHLGGATSLRTEMLPEQVITELRLAAPLSVHAPAPAPALLPLADKVAVAETDKSAFPELAEKLAVAETNEAVFVALADRVAAVPTDATSIADGPAVSDGSAISAEQARAATLTPTPRTTLASAAAGNSPVPFASGEAPAALGAQDKLVAFTGWLAVTLPSGETHLLAGVEISAYPADLLDRYLRRAGTKNAELARQLRDQATVAAQQGQPATSAALLARAMKTAIVHVDLLPAAPYTVRSDGSGRFTLRHNLRDFRLVAVAHIHAAQGQWTYAWIGAVPGEDSLLTEANATAVFAPPSIGSRFATR